MLQRLELVNTSCRKISLFQQNGQLMYSRAFYLTRVVCKLVISNFLKKISSPYISLSAFVAFLYCTQSVVHTYMTYPTYNTMETKCIENRSSLPALSICNANAFRKSQLAELNLTAFKYTNTELHDNLLILKGKFLVDFKW